MKALLSVRAITTPAILVIFGRKVESCVDVTKTVIDYYPLLQITNPINHRLSAVAAGTCQEIQDNPEMILRVRWAILPLAAGRLALHAQHQ